MLWSKLFIPTLREAPAGATTAGGRMLARAGYTRPYGYLYLGRRSLKRIAGIVCEELDSLGAQELLVPRSAVLDRLAGELRSYQQLPQIWYRLGPTVDAISFDASPQGLEQSYSAVLRCIHNIFRRCGVECQIAEALSGVQFVILSDAGEYSIARAGGYLADLASAVAEPKSPSVIDPDGDLVPEPFHTPNRKTIAELADFTGLKETSHIKSLVMAADGRLVMALVRGDHQLSRAKLARVLNTEEVRPANAEEIRERFAAAAGSLGPVGVAGLRILSDLALRGRRNMIAGANRDDYHLRNVTPGKDFETEFFDLRQAAEGDTRHGEPLRIDTAILMASLSKYELSRDDLHVTGETGKEIPLCIGSYSLELDRMLHAVAEQHQDADGLLMPPEIAPFDLIVTPVDYSNENQRNAAAGISESATALGWAVLLDDRDERPGVKFKDADLTGIPWRITIGKKLEQGIVEVFDRRSRQKSDVAIGEAVAFLSTRR